MTLKDVWEYGNEKDLLTLKALVELLVIDKRVCRWSDDWDRAKPYLAEKYQKAVSLHLKEYMKRSGMI